MIFPRPPPLCGTIWGFERNLAIAGHIKGGVSVTRLKRLTALLLAAVMLLTCTSCSDASPGSGTAAGETAADRLAQQTELNVMLVAGNFGESMQNIYSDYEEEFGVQINYTVLGVDTYFQKMLVEMSSGSDAYDVIYLMSPQFIQYASNGWLYPLDDFIADKTITDDALLDLNGLMESSVEAQRYDGKLYGIPVCSLTTLLYYRKDLFEAAGLDPERPPETWEELREYAQLLHKDGIAGIGMRGARSAGGSEGLIWEWPMVMYAMGGDFVADFPTDMTPTLNTPEVIESVDYYADLLQNYSIKGATTCNYEDITVAVQQGDLAMWIDGAAMVKNYIDPENSETREEDVGFAAVPAGPAGRKAPLNVHSLHIPANAKNKERAWHFIQWANSEETLVRLGTEGNLVTVARSSVYDDPTFISQNNIGDGAWLQAMNDSLANYAMPQYRPLNAEWPEVADIVSGYISDVFTGAITSQEAMEMANEEVAQVYRDAGYIS